MKRARSPSDDKHEMTEAEVNKVLRLEGREIPEQYKGKTSDECREVYQKYARQEIVALLNVKFAPNLGTVIRTACLWGFNQVLTFGKRKYDKRLAVGLHNYIPIQHITAIKDDELDETKVISTLKEYTANYTLVFIELHDKAISMYEMNDKLKTIGKHPLFIIGDELNGISTNIISSFPDSLIVQIPQPGIGRSHNVSIAFASVVAVYFANHNLER